METALISALTAYDRKEAGKPGHNLYALPIYLGRVPHVMTALESGDSPLSAVASNFHGRLLGYLIRTLKLTITCDYCDQPATLVDRYASDTDGEPLCQACAKGQFDDWQESTRKISVRDIMTMVSGW